MNKLYPTNLSKYSGSVYDYSSKYNECYLAKIINNGEIIQQKFTDYDEAVCWVMEKNMELDLLVKNIMYDCGDYYEVELNNNYRMKVNKVYERLVEGFTWWFSNGYVETVKNYKRYRFADLLLKKMTQTTDIVHYINGDKLDIRRANLKLIPAEERITKKNKSGHRGVSWCERDKSWKATWIEDNRVCTKAFPVKQHGDEQAKLMVIAYRQNKDMELAAA